MVDPRFGKGIGGRLGDASAAESNSHSVTTQAAAQLQPPAQVIAAWSKSARSLAPQQSPTATAPALPRTAPPSSPQQSPTATSPTPRAEQPGARRHAAEDHERIEPESPQALAPPAPGAQAAPTAAQKVVLYEEDPADPNGKRFVGSAIWRTAMVTRFRVSRPSL